MFLQEHVMASECSRASDKLQKCSCRNIVEICDDVSALEAKIRLNR
jgi:hypothetical protein